MQTEWNGYTIEVRGDWTYRWLYLAPEYELFIDDRQVDRTGGPILHPELEGLFEDTDGDVHHIEVEILSIVGYRPDCDITVDGEALTSGSVHVRNVLNPLLSMFILFSTVIMLYLGPSVLRAYVMT